MIRQCFLWFLLFLWFPWALAAQDEAAVSRTALEAARRNALTTILREQMIPFEEHALFAEYGGFGSSVQVAIPRTVEPETDITVNTLVMGIPLSSSGETVLEDTLPLRFEIALEFIKQIRTQAVPVDILITFLGDEFSSLPDDQRKHAHLGLADLYAALDDPENTVLLYLDIPDNSQSLVIHHGAGKSIAALNVLQPLQQLCESHTIPYSFAIRFNELYKLGLVKDVPVLQSAFAQGLNALYVTGSSTRPRSASETGTIPEFSAENVAAVCTAYALSLKISAKNLDYHFVILNFIGKYFFIPEQKTVILFLAVIGLFFFAFLTYTILYRKRLSLQWMMFLPYIWILPVFCIILVFSLETAGFLISFTAKLFHVSGSIKDLGRAILKIVIALLLISLFFPLKIHLKRARIANLYGSTASLLVTLGVFIAACLDITFVPIFIWVFLLTFLGSVVRIPVIIGLCALLTPLDGFGSLFNILDFSKGDAPLFSANLFFSTNRLIEIILSQDIIISLYLTVILLPFLLLLERSNVLSRIRTAKPLLSRRITTLLLLCLSLGMLVYYTWTLSKIPTVLPVRRTIIENAASPGSSGAIHAERDVTDILSIKTSNVTFLERRNIEITFEARGKPLCFNLYIDSEDGTSPVIYSAPMPFTFTNERTTVEFILGEGPPNPFTAELVLPSNLAVSLRVEAIYTTWDPAIDTLPPPESNDYVLQVVKSISLAD